MIRFSDSHLKIPAMQRPVFLVTAGQSKFARAIPDKRTEELCIEAFTITAAMIDKSPAALKSYIHSCYYGHFADHFGDQLLGEAVIHDRLGLDPLGNVGIKTGGATGGSALWEGFKTVASGYSDCVLVMGWERMDEVPTDEGNFLISCAADKDWESPLGHIYTGYYAVMAQRYWQIFGKAEESFRRTMAEISVKHHDPVVMMQAYMQLAEQCDYPLHLGVTEAGPAFQGTVKSAVAFGGLLSRGIGDTIRVSLSAPPAEEVKVGIAILESLNLRQRGLEIVSCPSCGRAQVDVYTLAEQVTAGLAGLEVPLRVAVMGCVVNGPGEAREADLGVASGNGKGQIFVRGEVIKTVPESQIVETLIEEAMVLAEEMAGESGAPVVTVD